MKTAIYVEDGVKQIVLTPENKFEKETLESFSDESIKVKIMNGAFYKCIGGYFRQSDRDSNDSLMLIVEEKGDKNE